LGTAEGDLYRFFLQEIDDPADHVGTYPFAARDFLVFFEDFGGDQPAEVSIFDPLIEEVGRGISARSIRTFESGDSGDEN